MARRWLALLVRAYPPRWQARYGSELEQLIADLRGHRRHSAPMAADLLRGAAAAWLTDRRSVLDDQGRRPLFAVLWSWVAFATTAAWFGRNAAEYPGASVTHAAERLHPAAVTAYDVLLGTGIAGIAVTGIAAVPFAVAAVRFALVHRRPVILAQVAVPPVVAGSWLAVLSLLGQAGNGTAVVLLLTGWLLVGVAGIAGATWAVTRVVAACDFPVATWQAGRVAATAITAVMAAATAATAAWGIATLLVAVPRGTGPAIAGWLLVVAIMAAAAARAGREMPAILTTATRPGR